MNDVGIFVKGQANNDMEKIESDVKLLKKLHKEVCNFYEFDQSD